jgi:hypothetical protein
MSCAEYHYAEWLYTNFINAECHTVVHYAARLMLMLSIIMLIVIILSVAMLTVIIMSTAMLTVIILSVARLTVIMLTVFVLSVVAQARILV